MFKDVTDYKADDGKKFSVVVGKVVFASGLRYGEALSLAKHIKGSRTVYEGEVKP